MAAREAMSSVDHAWLRMDQPTNLMMITGVLAFAKPLDYERVCNLLAERQLRFDRFRQRVVPPDTPLRSPKWQVDPNFDIHYHLRRVSLPAPGGQEALQALVSDLMSRPLEPDRPLWQYHLVENYERGSALVARLHHCIADGIALMRVLLSLTNESAEAEWAPPEKEKRPRRPGALARTVAGTWRVTETAVQEGLEMLLDPARALQLAHTGSAAVTRLGRILVRWPDPKTVFKGELGVEKRAAWSRPLALSDVKAVGSVTGGTVNDVLLTAMAGALRKYIRGRGEPVDGLNFHAVVPINLRPLDGPIELGNKFGLVFLALPIGIAGQVERLEEVRRRMDKLKRSPEAVALFGLLNVVGKGPAALENVLLNVFGTKATGIMTNVPGPRQQLYLAGSPLRDIMFWVPQSGRLGLGVSIVSYNDRVLLGVATDAGLVPDPEAIVDAFHEEFTEMMALVEMVRADMLSAGGASGDVMPDEEMPATQPARCQATTRSGRRCRNRARPRSATCHVHEKGE
jgi:WS/DGAT/MGAT family acyltransferase